MRKLSLALVALTVTVFACQKNNSTQEAAVTPIPTPDNVSGRICASDEVLNQQIASNPERGRFLEELEQKTRNYTGRLGRTAGTLYIPVVVNVVLPNADQVTNAQIQSQIDVLTQDFTKANAELKNTSVYLADLTLANVANVDVKFVVTNVFRRNNSATPTFGSNDAVKKTASGGLDPTEPTTKLNLWVCDLSSGLLGYAQFPGGAAATDGVVCDYQAFGTDAATNYPMYSQFNLGRTATHEVGHWVNLRHIWGDRRCGDDYVGDTPAHDGSNGGCPAVGLKSACSGKPLEQWMNYMDYTDDRCMYAFSSGQKTRMDAAIDNARSAYVRASSPTPALGFTGF